MPLGAASGTLFRNRVKGKIVERVEMTVSTGVLRQPGTWGKVLKPTGDVYRCESEPNVVVTVRKESRTLLFPGFDDGVFLMYGVRGYHGPGTMVNCVVLFGTLAGSYTEWQFPGPLVRFEVKGAQLLAHGDDLQTLYTALEAKGYAHLSRLRQTMRLEGIERVEKWQ
jgi:hypothetical protein